MTTLSSVMMFQYGCQYQKAICLETPSINEYIFDFFKPILKGLLSIEIRGENSTWLTWFFCKACQNFANCFKSGQPSSHQRLFQNFRCHFIQFKFFRSLGHNRISWISTLLKASQKYCLSFENKITYCALCICVKSEMCGDDGFTAHLDFIQK